MEIKLIRLVSREELITEFLGTTDSGYSQFTRIRNPMSVVVMRDKGGNPTVGFGPWAEFTKDQEISIDSRNIVCIMNPVDEFVSQYRAHTSGLVLPSNQGKILVP